MCRVLGSRARFCTRHLTAQVGSRSSPLPGGSQVGCAGLCSSRRLDFLRQHRVIFGRVHSRLEACRAPRAGLRLALFFARCTELILKYCVLLKCLALMPVLCLAAQRAKWQRKHQPLEGMEREVGQTRRSPQQWHETITTKKSFHSYWSCKKSVMASVEINQYMENCITTVGAARICL